MSPIPSKMILMSPHLQSSSLTKLSPLLNFARNKPHPKTSGFNTQAVSAFLNTLDNTATTVSQDASPSGAQQEEEKNEIQFPASMIQSARRTPWIDKTNAKNILLSPSINPVSVHIQQPSTPSLHGDLTYCTCGLLCIKGQSQCTKCCLKAKVPIRSGFIYESNLPQSEQLSRYWFSLMGKELYSK